jgi:hypothetical protein
MPADLDGLLWLVALLGPLLLLQRSLHREIQLILLMLTRRIEIAIALFSLLFFPGVLLHEGSHYLMARLLGVRTGRFSLLPRPLGDGKLQMGYVETAPSDLLRDALIGAAPLLAGGLFVAYAGLYQLGLGELWQNASVQDIQGFGGVLRAFWEALPALLERPDFWLWFYLTLTVSSTMLPSASDRRAWLPLAFTFALLLGLSLFVGAGPWLAQNVAPALNRILLSAAVVLGISVFVHLLLLPPTWALRIVLANLFKLELRY